MELGFIKERLLAKKHGEVVFSSYMGGQFTPATFGIYISTKLALEPGAEAMQQGIAAFDIKA